MNNNLCNYFDGAQCSSQACVCCVSSIVFYFIFSFRNRWKNAPVQRRLILFTVHHSPCSDDAHHHGFADVCLYVCCVELSICILYTRTVNVINVDDCFVYYFIYKFQKLRHIYLFAYAKMEMPIPWAIHAHTSAVHWKARRASCHGASRSES